MLNKVALITGSNDLLVFIFQIIIKMIGLLLVMME